MIEMMLSTIAQKINAKLIGEDILISEVFTDTRQGSDNSLFIALVGENFDAHNFVDKAEKQGAIALLVSRSVKSELPQLLVDDTEKALGMLANLVRKTVNPKVIGITGSAGKTSVKEMVARILQEATCKSEVLATAGNFNNHIGVPLTLLRLKGNEKYAVIEMGANHIGEIAYCASIAEPQVTVVNNVAPAHIEGFGSVEGVAKAKGEIYQSLDANGVGIINLDSDFSSNYQGLKGFHKVTVSRHNSADITADNIKLDENNCASFDMNIEQQAVEITLLVPGEHQVSNALVAAALAVSVGASVEDIQQGLAKSSGVVGRLNRFVGLNDSVVIDDTYNASVASVKVAVDVLSHWSGTKILALGDMAELGDSSAKYHREVGAYAKNKKINHLFTCGHWSELSSEAFGSGAMHCKNKKQLIDSIRKIQNKDTQVLVKGSRSARMEEVVEAIKANADQYQDEQHNSLGGGSQC